MYRREKHSSVTRKIRHYIKDGRAKKLKKLFKTFQESNTEHLFIDEVNRSHGKLHQTYLHKSCARGDSVMVRILLDFGADISCYDNNCNNILHHSLNYVLESFDQEYFETVVLYLLDISPQSMMNRKNRYGETVNELLSEVMMRLKNKKNSLLFENEGNESTYFDEKNWNEKLFFELSSESQNCDECYAQEEFEDTYQKTAKEDFCEWGDRIREEYFRKNNRHHSEERKKEEKEEVKQEIKYGPSLVDELRKQLHIVSMRSAYEKKCEMVFKGEGETLYFKHIPWPVAMDRYEVGDNVDEILDSMAELLTFGLEADDKRRYLKKQQVRWHPDRFLQKCDSRLYVEERESILKMVSSLSQRINSIIDSIT